LGILAGIGHVKAPLPLIAVACMIRRFAAHTIGLGRLVQLEVGRYRAGKGVRG
jgi:hypothetical protein